jgi:hypothetical protein
MLHVGPPLANGVRCGNRVSKRTGRLFALISSIISASSLASAREEVSLTSEMQGRWGIILY